MLKQKPRANEIEVVIMDIIVEYDFPELPKKNRIEF